MSGNDLFEPIPYSPERNQSKRLEYFKEWVREKAITGKCAECGKGPFAILGKDDANTVISLEHLSEAFHTYAFECQNCGYIKQFSAAAIEKSMKDKSGGNV